MQTLRSQIDQCMLADQAKLARRLRALESRRRRGGGHAAGLRRLRAQIDRSRRRRERRLTGRPRPTFPADLPITARRTDIAAAIARHPVVVVCGETGSGKTTQIPKICLELGRGAGGMIGHTQPRRVAARGVAARIAAELGRPLGETVGFKVRFTERVSEDCYVKVMTDGILLAEIQSDPELSAYDTIVIDEAHERSLNIDFLLGYLRRLLDRRADLRVVISSATIDTARFSEFFGNAPVIEVHGRGHPVEVRYLPPEPTTEDEANPQEAVVAAVEALCHEGPGDVLVFLSGEREIREASQALRRRVHGRTTGPVEILPVYARLPLAQQERIFTPSRARRIVLATNIAETSVTVPNVRYVVDPGYARISRYGLRATVQRLPVEPVSRASADQRMGRCGRTGPGVCVRLYPEEDYLSRPAFTEPEIRRTNLAAVLLRLRALGFDDPGDFPFLDPPDRRRVNDGHRLLRELGALDAQDRLTRLGGRLARLPIDPRIGRMILAAEELGCVSEVLVIAAALSVPDPRERPPGQEAAADAAHQRYRNERSDFLGLLKLWDYAHEQTRGLGAARVKAFCRKRFLSLARLREWQEVHRQLKELVRDMGLRPRRRGATYGRIHRALLTGLLRNVGARSAEREYTGIRDVVFRIAPGSGLAGGDAKWVVAAELVETTRLYAHTVASIRPEWIERAAADLVKRSHFEAHWDPRRAEVMVHEQASLYGLTVIPRRRVRYAPVSREDARAMFIQCALVEGRFASRAAFLRHNAAVIESLRDYERKLRRPGVLVTPDDVYDFYDRRVPSDVCDGKGFEAWHRRAEREGGATMTMRADDVQRVALPEALASDFPDELHVGEHPLALEYRFAPGEEHDGVCVVVPVDLLARLEPDRFDWLVPGLLREKVLAMLKLLPKRLRRALVPLTETADGFLREGARAQGALADALRAQLRERLGVEVPADAWRWDHLRGQLPGHLSMRFRVVDETGARLGEGVDLVELQRKLAAPVRAPAAARPPVSRYERQGLKSWPQEALPPVVEDCEAGTPIRGHPALVDEVGAVSLRLMASAEAAERAHGAGVRRLFMLGNARELRELRRWLGRDQAMALAYALVPEAPAWLAALGEVPANGAGASLEGELVEHAVALAMPEAEAVRSEAAFREARASALERLWPTAEELAARVGPILERYRALHAAADGDAPGVPRESLADARRQLAHLVYRGFIAATPQDVLSEYPRYLRALEVRLEKLRRGGAKDASKLADFAPLWDRLVARAASHAERDRRDPELARYRWMLEEYRVSLFAQDLGTAYRVSRQRLEEQWKKVAI